MFTSNELERIEAAFKNKNAKTQRWLEEGEKKTQSWINFIFSALFILIVAFISYFAGIDGWIRRHSVWFVLLLLY
jgi:hypothetical protein